MHPVLFKIGPLVVYTYGFLIFLGIISGYLFSISRASLYGLSRDKVADLIFWLLIFGFISARLFYVFVNWAYFIQSPLGLLFSRSGFIFYGGFLGALITVIVFAKLNKIALAKVLDLLAPGVALAHSLGRIGCYFYGCCFGKPSSSLLGLVFPKGSPAGLCGVAVIPTQLIEALFLILLFGFLVRISTKMKFPGGVFLTYVSLYSLFRFIIEFYRGDERGMLLGLSVSQWASLVFILAGSFFWVNFFKKNLKIPRKQI